MIQLCVIVKTLSDRPLFKPRPTRKEPVAPGRPGSAVALGRGPVPVQMGAPGRFGAARVNGDRCSPAGYGDATHPVRSREEASLVVTAVVTVQHHPAR